MRNRTLRLTSFFFADPTVIDFGVKGSSTADLSSFSASSYFFGLMRRPERLVLSDEGVDGVLVAVGIASVGVFGAYTALGALLLAPATLLTLFGVGAGVAGDCSALRLTPAFLINEVFGFGSAITRGAGLSAIDECSRRDSS